MVVNAKYIFFYFNKIGGDNGGIIKIKNIF